jgi:hypothetical protein
MNDWDRSNGLIALHHLSDACDRFPSGFIKFDKRNGGKCIQSGNGRPSAVIFDDFEDGKGRRILKTSYYKDQQERSRVSVFIE